MAHGLPHPPPARVTLDILIRAGSKQRHEGQSVPGKLENFCDSLDYLGARQLQVSELTKLATPLVSK